MSSRTIKFTLVYLSLAVLVCSRSAVSRADLTTGLQGYWRFDNNGLDSSGNSRDLSLVGNPGFAAGMFGQALDLHGNGAQYATRPIVDSVFNFGSGDFTIQTWVNFNADTRLREQTLIEQFIGSNGPGWTLTSPGYQWMQFYPILNVPDYPPTATGVWFDVVVNRSGDLFSIFVNGALMASQTSSGALSDSPLPLLIGRRNSVDSRDFSVDGRMDDVAIWNRALTNQEIAALWNNGQGSPVIGTQITAVPEPASLAIWCAIALIGLLGGMATRCSSSSYAPLTVGNIVTH